MWYLDFGKGHSTTFSRPTGLVVKNVQEQLVSSSQLNKQWITDWLQGAAHTTRAHSAPISSYIVGLYTCTETMALNGYINIYIL